VQRIEWDCPPPTLPGQERLQEYAHPLVWRVERRVPAGRMLVARGLEGRHNLRIGYVRTHEPKVPQPAEQSIVGRTFLVHELAELRGRDGHQFDLRAPAVKYVAG
jgi:hypothetical protein